MTTQNESPSDAVLPQTATDPSPGESAEKILGDSSYREIRGLKCRFRDGVLTVSGQLPSYYMKQIVLSAIRDIEGVERFEHLIEVRD